MEKEAVIQKIMNAGTNLTSIEIPEELKKDYDVALAIAKVNGYFIQKMDSSIIDKQIVLEALKSNQYAVKIIPEEFLEDKDVAMQILSKDGHMLWKMSDELTNDIDVVRIAIKSDPDAIKFASERIKNDKEFMKEYQLIKQDVEMEKNVHEEAHKQELLTKIEEYKNKDIWWNDSSIVNYEKLNENVTDDMVSRIETKYNKKLPSSYIELIKKQNGGRLIKRYFVNGDRVLVIDSILGISNDISTSSSIEGRTDMLMSDIKDWNLNAVIPEDVIVFGKDESGGHADYIFDYSELNEHNEPKIAYFDNELDQKAIIAENFEEFIANLKIKEEVEID